MKKLLILIALCGTFNTASAEIPIFAGAGSCSLSECIGTFEQGIKARYIALNYICSSGICQMHDNQVRLVHLQVIGGQTVDVILDVVRIAGELQLIPRNPAGGYLQCPHSPITHICEANPGASVCNSGGGYE